MVERKCSNCRCSRVKSYMRMFLGFLYRLVEILQITKILGLQRKAIQQQVQSEGISTYQITKCLQFITEEKESLQFDSKTFKLANPTGKPLCVMFTWMFAEQKYIKRYTQIYFEQGFDVLTVAVTALHAMWPAKGTQVTAANVLKFLHANDSAAPIMVHGFSVGAYMWGEVGVIVANSQEKNQSIWKRIVAQVWDSMVDFDGAQKGFPMAIFPKSKLMQNVISGFFKFYLKVFHNIVLMPMMRASGKYHNAPCPAPALIFISSTDPLCDESTIRAVKDKWTSLGVKVTFKCWNKSPHVQHLAKHPKEYLTLLYSHMEQAGLLKDKEKMNARLKSVL